MLHQDAPVAAPMQHASLRGHSAPAHTATRRRAVVLGRPSWRCLAVSASIRHSRSSQEFAGHAPARCPQPQACQRQRPQPLCQCARTQSHAQMWATMSAQEIALQREVDKVRPLGKRLAQRLFGCRVETLSHGTGREVHERRGRGGEVRDARNEWALVRWCKSGAARVVSDSSDASPAGP